MYNEDFQNQRDAYFTPLNDAIPSATITIVMRDEVELRDEEDGADGRRVERILLDVGTAHEREVEEYILGYYPPEHCQHAHDCCGHYYQQYPQWERSGKFVLVTLTYMENV